jgi:hypothetical protein
MRGTVPAAPIKPDDAEGQVKRVTAAVVKRTGLALPLELVERTVRDCLADFDAARIKDYVGVLVERRATDRLRAMAEGMA